MKYGKVIAYSEDVGAGIIRCDQGRKHVFFLSQWEGKGALPGIDNDVVFVEGATWATHVSPVKA